MGNSSCLSLLMNVLDRMSYDEIPQEVLDKTKMCMADFIGVFCSGQSKNESKKLYAALKREQGLPAPEDMAFWMGGASRLLDLDDGHRFAMGHPGVVIHAATIAAAANTPDVDGKKVLEALVKGYEVYCYQGRVVNPSAYLKRGFDATCICGAAGAAAAAGTVYGLSRAQLADAISLAASLCGGLNQYAIDGSSPKYLCAGWAAKLGMVAANLARYGMGGPSRIFEGRLGYCNGFAPEPDLELLHHPKLNWEVLFVYLKKYSCVRRIHNTLDVVEELMIEGKLDAAQISKVEVYGGQFLYDAAVYEPCDLVQAQTSVPYAVALLLRYGQVTCELVEENLKNPEIAALSNRIRIIKDEEMMRFIETNPSLWGVCRVEITTVDGKFLTGKSEIAWGDPEKPFTSQALHDKFIGLVSEPLGQQAAEQLWNQINTFEACKQPAKLMEAILQQRPCQGR